MTLESPRSTLERFHRVLVEEIRDRRPEYLSSQFTVAEIYQQLVPYASHRDRLGVDMNGDYEDALLRLLAGEGGYLRVESDHARERMKNEIESANPDTSLFREFAAVDVRLNPDRISGESDASGPDVTAGQAPGSEPGEETPPHGDLLSVDDLAPPPDRMPGGDEPTSPVEGHPEPSPHHPTVEPTTSEAGGRTCSWCRETLPERDNLNFCPFCGTDVDVVPCESCGEALEPGWLFCIACGSGVSDA